MKRPYIGIGSRIFLLYKPYKKYTHLPKNIRFI